MIVVPFHQDERLGPGVIPVPGPALTVDPPVEGADIWQRLRGLHDAVADAVAGEIRAGGTASVLSGDCLVGLGVLAGVQRAGIDPSIIWFDAHGDAHTLATSTSGYLGGLALRLVLGAHRQTVAGPLGLRPLTEDRVVLVDARDLDPAESDYLATAAITRCPVDAVTVPDGPLVLHIDLDVVDGAEVPGLLFPVAGGPPASAVVAAANTIMATGRVVALHLACTWNCPAGSAHEDLVAALAG